MCKIKKGQIITGIVTGIQDYGIFVNISDDYKGLIHISEISDNYVRNINKYAEVGNNIKAKIIDINENKKELKLSIKDLNKSNFSIRETGNKFKPLKDNLDNWIDEYEKNNEN